MATHSLQYSCLENPMDRRAWWATVREVTESHTLSTAWLLLNRFSPRPKGSFIFCLSDSYLVSFDKLKLPFDLFNKASL